jgi:hypothetical protein
MTTIQEVTHAFAWETLVLPHHHFPLYGETFPAPEALSQIMDSADLHFAPGLREALMSPTAPPIEFFRSLAVPQRGTWGVYCIVMEKDKCKPLFYVGSGTLADVQRSGIAVRAKAHVSSKPSTLFACSPCQFVAKDEQALDNHLLTAKHKAKSAKSNSASFMRNFLSSSKPETGGSSTASRSKQ